MPHFNIWVHVVQYSLNNVQCTQNLSKSEAVYIIVKTFYQKTLKYKKVLCHFFLKTFLMQTIHA